MNYTCKNCGSTFIAPKNKNRPRKYCSNHCKGLAQERKGLHTSCAYCNITIYIKPSEIVQGKKKYYCSLAHYGKDIEVWPIKHVCKFCNKPFTSSYRGPRKYCSKTCSNASNLEIIVSSKGTNKFEIACYNMLDSLSINYTKQAVINNKFVVDALINNRNIIIEFDGDYWHGNPDKFPVLNNSQIRTQQRDKSRRAYLEKCGYRIIRFWRSDFITDVECVKNKILKEINEVSCDGC